MVPERVQGTRVGRHGMVVEVAPLHGDRLVHALPQLLLDHPQLRLHAVPPALPPKLEFAGAGLATDEGKAQEVEALRLAEPAPQAAFCREASELDQPGLLGMQRQRKLPQPLAHLVQEAPGVLLVLEADGESRRHSAR